jgi:hypothetical protein
MLAQRVGATRERANERGLTCSSAPTSGPVAGLPLADEITQPSGYDDVLT